MRSFGIASYKRTRSSGLVRGIFYPANTASLSASSTGRAFLVAKWHKRGAVEFFICSSTLHCSPLPSATIRYDTLLAHHYSRTVTRRRALGIHGVNPLIGSLPGGIANRVESFRSLKSGRESTNSSPPIPIATEYTA